MKITKQQLKKIIKEELKKTLEEAPNDFYSEYTQWAADASSEAASGRDPQDAIDRRSTRRFGRDSSGYPIKCIPDENGHPLGHEAVVSGRGVVRKIIKKNSEKCTADTVAAHK
jgi:hypothetical protein